MNNKFKLIKKQRHLILTITMHQIINIPMYNIQYTINIYIFTHIKIHYFGFLETQSAKDHETWWERECQTIFP